MSAARRIAWRDNPVRRHKRLARRLSRRMNLPYRLLYDPSLSNHWSAWQIDQQYLAGILPPAETITLEPGEYRITARWHWL